MKWQAASKNLEPRYFVIKHDKAAGFYLYVYENDRCIRDHLQDTFTNAIEEALEKYGVQKESRKETKE